MTDLSTVRRLVRKLFTFYFWLFTFPGHLWFGAVFLLTINSAIFGGTLGEYKKNIVELQKDIAYLILPDEGATSADIENYEEATAARFKKLPSKVEFQGTALEIDNLWLSKRFKQTQKEPSRRSAILKEVGERLTAIEQKITELEISATAERSKDEDKQKLNEILKREEFRKPEPPEESFIQGILRSIREWFNEQFPQPDVPPGTTEGLQSTSVVLQILLYAVILGALGFFIYRFAPFLASKFRRFEKKENEDRIILGEKLGRDENAQSLFSEAERLARDGNLRGAIRKGYIALLCELNDRKVIGLAWHKTNRDYLRDVRKDRTLHQNMNGLTNSFERHWYGFENAGQADWEEFRQGYQRTLGGRQ